MQIFPKLIQQLINHFSSLPGLGPKTAKRLVFYLLKQDKNILSDFGNTLLHIKDNIQSCSVCGQVSENNLCQICSNKNRDHSLICVIAESSDITSLEKSGQFSGVYHVLNGLIKPTEGLTADKLNIQKLEERIKNSFINSKQPTRSVAPTFRSEQNNNSELKLGATILKKENNNLIIKNNNLTTKNLIYQPIKEIILALNPTIEGETTNLYLTKILKKYNIKITKLARGLPQGSDLEYADEVTLANAIKGRTQI